MGAKNVANAGPEPAVIDEELCRRCLLAVKQRPTSGEGAVGEKEATLFREVPSLLLSYQNVLKIDNLVGFDKLVKLQQKGKGTSTISFSQKDRDREDPKKQREDREKAVRAHIITRSLVGH